MTTIETSARTIQLPEEELIVDEAQLAAVAFLARYSGRTLDAYRHDLRGFFQWTADSRFSVLAATRPHVELYRTWMEERGLRRQRSTGACRRYVGSTGSPTSTVASPRTPPSTSGDPRFIR